MAVGRVTEILNDISPDFISSLNWLKWMVRWVCIKLPSTEKLTVVLKSTVIILFYSSTKIESATFFRNDHEFKPLIEYPKIYYGYGPDQNLKLAADGFFFGDLRFALNSEAILAPGLSYYHHSVQE